MTGSPGKMKSKSTKALGVTNPANPSFNIQVGVYTDKEREEMIELIKKLKKTKNNVKLDAL